MGGFQIPVRLNSTIPRIESEFYDATSFKVYVSSLLRCYKAGPSQPAGVGESRFAGFCRLHLARLTDAQQKALAQGLGADDSSDCGSGIGYGAVETDMLLGRVASSKARPQILNLTHIDDEIDFADDDVVVFK